MTRRTVTALTEAIRKAALFQLALLAALIVSFEWFINLEVAFLSAFGVMLGSMYSYSRLVNKRLEQWEAQSDKDPVDAIDDPYDLYDDERSGTEPERAPEEIDIKELIKEEKQRIRAAGGAKQAVKSAPAMVSLYRVIPYLLLVVGFIGLNNNGVLALWPYLTGLGVGIAAGYFVGKGLFAPKI